MSPPTKPSQPPVSDLKGFEYHAGFLNTIAQNDLARDILTVVEKAPYFIPHMPRTGKAFSVHMTNCGSLGWMSDKTAGYRYVEHHPETLKLWPAIPSMLLEIWQKLTAYKAPPEACLINYYGPDAKMGLHIDADERDMTAPVVSISLGCAALFRIGGRTRKAPTRSFRLCSGDVVVLGGEVRRAYHGIDRIYPGTSELVGVEGRINLTMRRVTCPPAQN